MPSSQAGELPDLCTLDVGGRHVLLIKTPPPHPTPLLYPTTSILVQSCFSHTPLRLDGRAKRATSKNGTPSGAAVSSCPPLFLLFPSHSHTPGAGKSLLY